MPQNCSWDDGNAAALLATNMDTGDTLGVCGDHVIPYALGVLEAASGQTWAPVEGSGVDPATGDQTDEPESVDGSPVEDVPAPDPVPPADPAPGPDDDPGYDPEAYARHVRIMNGEDTHADRVAEATA